MLKAVPLQAQSASVGESSRTATPRVRDYFPETLLWIPESLAISALTKWRATHSASAGLDAKIRQALVFLLRGRDARGSWFSTQPTLRAMRAFADAALGLGINGSIAGGSVEIRSNGQLVKTVLLPSDPILVDLSAFLSAGQNQIALSPSENTPFFVVGLTVSHWVPWKETTPKSSPGLRLSVQYDRQDVGVGMPVRCTVKAERVGFRGYGMILAEIGLPPGAEVNRESLESLLEDGSVDRYEILPGKIVFHLWPLAGGSSFEFFLSARLRMNAKTTTSILYDYHNPEALSEVVPTRWTVQ